MTTKVWTGRADTTDVTDDGNCRVHLSHPDLTDLYRYALAACRNRGFPIEDTEYESCINYAVARAMATFAEHNQRRASKGLTRHSLPQHVTNTALHSCRTLREKLRRYNRVVRTQSTFGHNRLDPDQADQCDCPLCTLSSPARDEADRPADLLTDDEYQVLLFVHAHGRAAAAQQLGLRLRELSDLVDQVEFNIHKREHSNDPNLSRDSIRSAEVSVRTLPRLLPETSNVVNLSNPPYDPPGQQ